MKKTIIVAVAVMTVLSIGVFYFFNESENDQTLEQTVLEQTVKISREYASLRYRTDNVLLNAKEYGDYDIWEDEMTSIINKWQALERSTGDLEKAAQKLGQEQVSFHLTNQALAYDLQDAERIINNAPPLGRIAALAKHYGVDAKMAQLILNQTADQVTREAYGEEGDVFQTCENNAMRIKNGAKVTVFVGTIVATGGTSALAASGALAQTAVVVSGADLALEITEDEARIALGDKNKVSSLVSNIRAVTEPVAGILSIATMPENVSKAIDKFGVAYLGVDQIRSVIQDEKILGISIKIDEKGEIKTQIASLTEEELPQWKQDNNIVDSKETVEDILSKNQSEKEIKQEETTEASKKEDSTGDIKSGLMTPGEFEKLFDDKVAFETISVAKKIFGEPDSVKDHGNGHVDYTYNTRLVFPDGTPGGFIIRFDDGDVQGYSTKLEL